VILIDTSVVIDISRGIENYKVSLFRKIIERGIPYGISIYAYTEILQGTKNEKEFKNIENYLYSSFRIYYLPNELKIYADAAKIYYYLRRSGKTIRNTIDILIAQTAILNGLYLLHNDRDFDIIAEVISELKICNSLEND